MEYKDYYQVLGVDRTATEKQIRQAYRRLARQYHPDVNPGDKQSEAHFKEINEANEVLTDAEKRRKYDQLGSSYQQYQSGGGDPSGFDWSQWQAAQGAGRTQVKYETVGDMFQGSDAFSDFFESLFGQAGRGESPRRTTRRGSGARAMAGQDVEQPVQITLPEAYGGTARLVQRGDHRIEVRIPAGVKTGSKVRVAGAGMPGSGGGRDGDLYLLVDVSVDSRFERDGDDLRTEASVDVYTAALGGTVSVATLGGTVNLKIPPETQGGQVFRIRGKGMRHLGANGTVGDLYVRIRLMLPDKLTDREKQVWAELAAARA
jgi:curved DNA-binding protein